VVAGGGGDADCHDNGANGNPGTPDPMAEVGRSCAYEPATEPETRRSEPGEQMPEESGLVTHPTVSKVTTGPK